MPALKDRNRPGLIYVPSGVGCTVSSLLAGLPWWAYPAAVVIVIALLAASVRSLRSRFSVQCDPQRVFTAAERKVGNDRAGNRCEHKPMLGRRCTEPGTQGDHIIPWSAGGATVMNNYQSLCARDNQVKSNRRPSALTIWRLQRRRRKYFPRGTDTSVSWKFGRS